MVGYLQPPSSKVSQGGGPEQNTMQIKTISKQDYPFLLKQITALPQELHYIGKIPDDSYKFLCVVGARHYSEYGRDACTKLISGLKGYPIVIVSGLAFGIDSIAHRAALENELITIAFPGSGLSQGVIYPKEHLGLAKEIVKSGGALISPFSHHQTGAIWTFPARNRLMAGISHATLIVEAKKGSGTLITADFVTEFSRDLMIVPGSIFNELSYGPHMLMDRGARPICSSVDILESLDFVDRSKRTEVIPQLTFDYLILTNEERKVIEELKIQSLQGSELALKTQLPPAILNTTLSRLEIKNLITESGGFYRIIHV